MKSLIEKLRGELDEARRHLAEAGSERISDGTGRQAAGLAFDAVQRNIELALTEWMTALDAVRDPIFLHDQQFRVMRCNRAYQQCAGLPFKEIIGQPYFNVFPKMDAPFPTCERAWEPPFSNDYATEEIAVDDRTYRSRAYVIEEEPGVPLYALHILEDISDSKKAEEALRRSEAALRESEAQARSVTATAVDAIMMIDDAGRITYWNPAATRMFGYDEDEVLGKNLHDLMAPVRYHEAHRKAFAAFAGTGKGPVVGKTVNLEALRKDGTEFPIELSVSSFRRGGHWQAVGIVRDVSERKQVEEALRSSRDLLRSVLESIPVRVFWKDRKSRYLGCNTLFARDAGLSSPDDLAGKDDYQMGWRDQADLYRADDEGVMASGTPKLNFEEPQTTPDGRTIWLRTSKVPLPGPDGSPIGMLGVYDDITARKETEETLRRSQKILAEAERIAQLGSWELDLIGGKLDWSDEIYRIFEIDPVLFANSYEAFMGAVHPDDRAAVDAAYTKHLKERVPYDIVHRLLFDDGRVKYVQERCETSYDGDRPVRSLGTVQDITERRLAELALANANRTLRTLSAGNGVLVRASDEAALLREMCATIVKNGGYRLAWVGMVEHDEKKTVRPAANAGFEDGYLDSLHLTWEDNEQGQGPTGRAVRLGTVQIAANILTDPQFAPWREQALRRGYGASIALPLKDTNGAVFGVLNIYAVAAHTFDDAEVHLLQELADDLAFGVLSRRTALDRTRYQQESFQNAQRLKEALVGTIRSIALTVEKRDPYTAGHQNRVADLAVAIGGELGLDEDRIEGLRLGGMIHDIGKIYIPAEILNRPGKLTDPEFQMIKSHPAVGYDIVKDVAFPWPVADMVVQHHERMNGTGYPSGLKGDAIILEARILAVADVVEAITSHRPYRAAVGLEDALAEIKGKRGVCYDAGVVDACLRLFREKGYSLRGAF